MHRHILLSKPPVPLRSAMRHAARLAARRVQDGAER